MQIFKFLISLLILQSTLFAIQLNWSHNYEMSLIQAKKEHKDVYLFIGADACRFCDKFKKTALSDKKTLKRLKDKYVVLYLSRDQHKIPSRFKTKGVPRHYFLTSNGKLFYEDWGGREVKGFNLMLDEAELSRH